MNLLCSTSRMNKEREGRSSLKQRIGVIDALRGFSLFGILLANLLIFQYGIYGKDEWDFGTADAVGHDILKVFVETSFMPIFAFLFGYGIILMYSSWKEKGFRVKRQFTRRFLALIVLGLLHGILLWEGDILFAYGMMGFFLLLFVKRKPKTLLIWGIVVLILTSAFSYGSGGLAMTSEEQTRMDAYVEDTVDIYGSGTFVEIMTHRSQEDPLMLGPGLMFLILALSPFLILPMFLFGMYVAKRQLFNRVEADIAVWKRGALWLTLAGLGLKSMIVWMPDSGWSGIGYALGGPLLALGYICLFTAAFHGRSSLFVRGMEAVGRLSLTNYLLQTVCCIFIFYGFGLGLFASLGIWAGIAIGVLVFSLQAALSLWYSRYFRQGPMEKIIRMFTYWSFKGKNKRPQPSTDLPKAQ